MGTSCLLTARVNGCRRVPEPPARMMPFSMKSKSALSSALSPEPQSLPLVPPALNLFAPVAVLEIPAHRLLQSRLERVSRLPSELAADLGRIDRIPAIVTRTIGHERLQLSMGSGGRCELVHRVADAIDDFEVRALVSAAHVVLLAEPAGLQAPH